MHAPGAPPHPSATAGEWQSGAVVGGRYRLVAPLGRGAMGEVWRAEHVYLHSQLALKLIATRDRGSGPEALARFSREAQAAAVLRSPHVVHIFDHGVDGDAAFIAMELLEGESLFDRLRRAGRLDPTDTARILAQMARAVDRAHAAGIVHRDLKPQNIFLAHVDGREVVKVLDFGIAKMTVLKGMDALATQEGFMVGTPCYMSPEQILGNRLVDGQSDLWQLGVVAFECTCGRLPFQSEAVGELMVQICSAPLPVPSRLARVPDGFDAWAARALARAPAERFASGHELAASLCRVLAPHTTSDRLADEPAPWAPQRYAAAEGAGAASPQGPPTTGRERAWASAVGARPAA
ncbi:MAG: serine/threonine protein kinase, partial [Myxococcales bacterium]|nr:serine/threonine protein kinase [Myxococcales bacterium]